MLLLDSGSKLAVGQWIAWWSGLDGRSSSRRKNCRLGEILKLSYERQATKGWDHLYWGSWALETPYKDFNLAIGRGLLWMKWLENGMQLYIYSCTISFLVKIFLINLKYLHIKYAWISIMKKQNSNQNVNVERWWYLSKLLTITITSFNFFSCPVNCNRIWYWNLDRNLILALLIMAICTVLFEKLHTVLRKKEPRRQEINNFNNLSFKMLKTMRFLRSLNVQK